MRVKNIYLIFLNLHTMSAKQELTAGPAKLHSQIFYYTARGFINNNIHALIRRTLHLIFFSQYLLGIRR